VTHGAPTRPNDASTLFDAVVVGGGPAGAATAAHLAGGGMNVVVLDASSGEHLRIGETIPPRIRPLLHRLGLWDRFLALEPIPSCGVVARWGGDEPKETDFLFDPYGTGWHIDRAAFDRMMLDGAARAGVVVRRGARAVGAARTDEGWVIDVIDGSSPERIRGRRVVIATGRGTLGAGGALGRLRTEDSLLALAAWFVDSRDGPLDSRLRVEATSSGWWYTAPLPAGRRVVVWVTDAEELGRARGPALQSLWSKQLKTAPLICEVLALSTPVAPLRSFSAAVAAADAATGPAWTRVGDAALAVDPLSGKGILEALDGAAVAAADLLREPSGGAVEDPYAAWFAERRRQHAAAREAYYRMIRGREVTPFWARRAEPHAESSVRTA
jgi:flavin-dependent dehydrogenase